MKNHTGRLLLLLVVLMNFCVASDLLAEKTYLECSAIAGETNKKAEKSQLVKIQLVANRKEIEAGKPFLIGVKFRIEPGWHIYYKEAGDAGMPTQISWGLPAGYTAGPLLWQEPKHFDDSGIKTNGYGDETFIASQITPPANLDGLQEVLITANVKWLSCKESCIPGKEEVEIKLPVGKEKPDDSNQALFSSVGYGEKTLKPEITGGVQNTGQASGENLLNYFLLAMLGGFILNFMPCVLPVIAIKILSFMEQADESPARVRRLGLVFSAGVMSAFLALALVVVAVRAAGNSVGWGTQFQNPLFLIVMCVIVLLLSLSLFGIFYINIDAGQEKLDALSRKEGMLGTFFKGVLATTLSTPCTAPFLGAAMGFAFAQPEWIVIGIFLASGLGMSLPYIILTAKPEWMKFLPKPGAWMEKFKESMGFIMLGTVIWLLNVLGSQIGPEGVMWVSFFLTAVALSAWLVGGFIDLSSDGKRKSLVWSIALFVSLIAGYFCIIDKPIVMSALSGKPIYKSSGAEDSSSNWIPFSPSRLEAEIANHKTVLLDFTADWCLTCKLNETTVLSSATVKKAIADNQIVTMKADWTRGDPEITALLKKFNRSGVPLYVVYSKNDPSNPIVLPELLTEQILLDALKK